MAKHVMNLLFYRTIFSNMLVSDQVPGAAAAAAESRQLPEVGSEEMRLARVQQLCQSSASEVASAEADILAGNSCKLSFSVYFLTSFLLFPEVPNDRAEPEGEREEEAAGPSAVTTDGENQSDFSPIILFLL